MRELRFENCHRPKLERKCHQMTSLRASTFFPSPQSLLTCVSTTSVGLNTLTPVTHCTCCPHRCCHRSRRLRRTPSLWECSAGSRTRTGRLSRIYLGVDTEQLRDGVMACCAPVCEGLSPSTYHSEPRPHRSRSRSPYRTSSSQVCSVHSGR